uniref:FAM3 metabolism regulating signaling molecule D n=1 Tax=Neolamprologus brichardi TaxID=32507 RepID=A0A3Q4HPB7_NEOBR
LLLTAVLPLAAVIIVLLITWGISINSSAAQERERNTLAPPTSVPKCSLSRVCPPSHIALRIRSGAADIVGPTVCFDGKIIMSHALNNVGPGLNIAVINGEYNTQTSHKHGALSFFYFFFIYTLTKDPKDILAHLKKIKRGMIVLVASFDDVTQKMTNEMREIFSEMGSTLISSVKRRDSWVFAGRAGTKIKSLFEKQAVNDEKNNIYGGWPEMVEVGGCFPRIY